MTRAIARAAPLPRVISLPRIGPRVGLACFMVLIFDRVPKFIGPPSRPRHQCSVRSRGRHRGIVTYFWNVGSAKSSCYGRLIADL